MTIKIPEPMNTRRAIEAIKILAPYVPDISLETEPLSVIRVLLEKIQERNPVDSIRLVALLHSVKVTEVADFLDQGKGRTLISALGKGFAANPLPDLVNAGVLFGLIAEEWGHARRTN